MASPLYMTVDPECIKNIISKDFNHFTDRGIFYNERDDPLSAHLFSIGGDKWKHLRTKLTPTFTSGKMKMMFQTLVDCGNQMMEFIEKLEQKNECMDVKEVCACYTTDVIGSCAFGIECNCFKDPNAEFRFYGNKVFKTTKMQTAKLFFGFVSPKLARKLRFKTLDEGVAKFFMNAVKSTVQYREENNYVRKDFMQLLIELKNNADGTKNQLTIEEIAAQAFVFFLAGFETSSTTMTFCLFELAKNQQMQKKVREEILQVLAKHDGQITYEGMQEMKYLGQVIDETLRMYPPLPILNRTCTKPYTLPDTDITIEEGTNISIPIYGIQHDPEYFPDPERFDPDRFSDENKGNIIPYTYLPFGEGPRVCIGLRFGVMQARVGLTTILKNFVVNLNEKTQLPLVCDPYSFTYNTIGKIWLDVKKI